jgi:AcrR family transcriptional regulator
MVKNRKDEILSAAYNLFITKGYDNTSVDEIIEKVNIAKGTFYYYFTSKEEMLDEVINKMINEEIIEAKKVVLMPIPIEQKVVGIVTSLRPKSNELNIVEALNNDNNIKMHMKYNKRIIDEATIILKDVVLEGIDKGVFNCTNIEERIKLLLKMSNDTFDDNNFTNKDVEVYIDMVEKLLGANPGTMNFISTLIGGYNE